MVQTFLGFVIYCIWAMVLMNNSDTPTMEDQLFFEEAKLAHPNCHQRESNLKPRGGAHSQIPSQYHHYGGSTYI